MENPKFLLIAATLGLSVPATLLGLAVDAEASQVMYHSSPKDLLKYSINNSSASENPITQRMVDLLSTKGEKESRLYAVHTDSYTNNGGQHTDYTTPPSHTDTHIDSSNQNTCPVQHTDYHTNYGNSHSSHTDYATPYADKHTDYNC